MQALASLGCSARSFRDALFDFVFPPVCLLCNRYIEEPVALVCVPCWQQLPLCENHAPARSPDHLAGCFSLWEYRDAVETLIHEVKFLHKPGLGRRIGAEVAKLIRDYSPFRRADIVVPVPLYKTRLRERGFNQSALIAAEIAAMISAGIDTTSLRRIRQTGTQTKLNATQRRENVAGAFQSVPDVAFTNKTVIVVDDVLTTGSTLSECARALCDAGAKTVLAITAARTPLEHA